MIHKGNLEIEKNDKPDYSKITEITGDLIIYEKISLPNLIKVSGDVHLGVGSNLNANSLTTIGGFLDIGDASILEADNLVSVSGKINVRSDTTLPALDSVGGILFVGRGFNLNAPKLNKNKRKYYDLPGALYMAKNHSLQFSLTDYCETLSNYRKFGLQFSLKKDFDGILPSYNELLNFIKDNFKNSPVLAEEKFYVINTEVLEPIEGDQSYDNGEAYCYEGCSWVDSRGNKLDESFNYKLKTCRRNGLLFLPPQYWY